jgi:hypothetical protein
MATSTKNRDALESGKRRKAAMVDPKLDKNIQGQLGTLLQRMYSDLLHEPVPDRFTQILKGFRPTEPEDRS